MRSGHEGAGKPRAGRKSHSSPAKSPRKAPAEAGQGWQGTVALGRAGDTEGLRPCVVPPPPPPGLPHVKARPLERETPRGLAGTEPRRRRWLKHPPHLYSQKAASPSKPRRQRPAGPPPPAPAPTRRRGLREPARPRRTHSRQRQKLRGKPGENDCLTLSEPFRGGGCGGCQHQAQAEDGGCRGLSLHGVGAGSSGTPGTAPKPPRQDRARLGDFFFFSSFFPVLKPRK